MDGRGIHLAHLNVRSMMGGHKLDILKLQIENSNIEIFTLSETWLNTSVPDKVIELPSYNTCRLDRSWGARGLPNLTKKGGGLLVYIKKGLEFSDSQFADLNVSSKDLEMQWISLRLNYEDQL